LRQDYRDDLTLEEAKVLGLKAIAKSLDTANITAEKLEIATLTRDPTRRIGQQVVHQLLSKEEITALIAANRDVLVRKGDEEDEDLV
jgi:20S proteasome subunit alpha 3